jgi:hypothetical protein
MSENIYEAIFGGQTDHLDIFIEYYKNKIHVPQFGDKNYIYNSDKKLWVKITNNCVCILVITLLLKIIDDHINQLRNKTINEFDEDKIKKTIKKLIKVRCRVNTITYGRDIFQFIKSGVLDIDLMNNLVESFDLFPINDRKCLHLLTCTIIERKKSHYFSYEFSTSYYNPKYLIINIFFNQKLKQTELFEQELAKYIIENNPNPYHMESLKPRKDVIIKNIYNKFCKWCKENRIKTKPTLTNFTKALIRE